MAETVDYLYCVVPAAFELGRSLTGIDEAAVRLIPAGEIAALVSTLDGTAYHAETVAQRLGDLEWLKPRAVAHDRIVTWASDRAPAVPMPMWTLFGDDESVRTALRERYTTFHTNLQRLHEAREYTVRVFATSEGITAALATLSPKLAELEQSLTGASPGQAYLLRRKIEAERKTEIRAIARRLSDETYTELSCWAVDAVREPVPHGEEGSAVLNASFLVPNLQYDDFRRALTDLIARYQLASVRFDFTGPWPAYHFVRES